MCSATRLTNETGMLKYSMKKLFRWDFIFLRTLSYVSVCNLKQLRLFFSEIISMYPIMTSALAGLFLNSCSAVSLKNLFSMVGTAFNQFYSSVTFLYHLKMSENLWFSDVFREYRNLTLESNGWMCSHFVWGCDEWLSISFYCFSSIKFSCKTEVFPYWWILLFHS